MALLLRLLVKLVKRIKVALLMYLLYVGLEYLHFLWSEGRLLVQNLLAAYVFDLHLQPLWLLKPLSLNLP